MYCFLNSETLWPQREENHITILETAHLNAVNSFTWGLFYFFVITPDSSEIKISHYQGYLSSCFSSTRKCPAHLLYTGTSLGAVQTAGVLNRASLIVINIILAMLCSGSRQKIYVQWFGTRSQSSVTVLQFEINQLSLVCSEQYSAFLNEIKPSQK